MTKMNWNKVKTAGVSYAPKRQRAMKLKRRDELPASAKQKAFMNVLGIEFPKRVTLPQARQLISGALKREAEIKKQVKLAMQRDRR